MVCVVLFFVCEADGQNTENDVRQAATFFGNYLDSLNRLEDKAIDSTKIPKRDSIVHQFEFSERKLKFEIDSLKAKGQLTPKLRKYVDSLEHNLKSLTKNYDSIQARLRQKLEQALARKVPGRDTLKAIQNKAAAGENSINEISTELGIGPLGSDLKAPQLSSPLPGNLALPQGPTVPQGTVPALPSLPDEKIDPKVPKLPNVEGKIKEEADQAGLGEVKAAGKEVEQYSNDLKQMHPDSLAKPDRLEHLAEEEALKIDEVKAIKETQPPDMTEMEKYQKLIEQYKNEQKIAEELREKSKEVVNDLFEKNKEKINASLTKFRSRVPKYRRMMKKEGWKLPEREPDPMKKLSWRDRLVPGLTLQTLSGTQQWLEVDPQVYWRFTHAWSAGVGGTYRFSMVASKLTFSDFDNLYGAKVFAQYHAFKGFFLRAEGQWLNWKPWDTYQKDPTYREEAYVGMLGIGRAHNIAKKIRANVQTLYHISSNASDPYKQRIVIRFGLEFSLSKRVKQPWEQRLKDLKHCK